MPKKTAKKKRPDAQLSAAQLEARQLKERLRRHLRAQREIKALARKVGTASVQLDNELIDLAGALAERAGWVVLRADVFETYKQHEREREAAAAAAADTGAVPPFTFAGMEP